MVAIVDKNHYRLHSVKRYSFQKACKLKGWAFDEFAEKLAPRKSGNNKTYYYKHVGFSLAKGYNEGKIKCLLW